MANQYIADVTRLTTNDSGWRDPTKCQIAAVHTFECPRSDRLEHWADWQHNDGSGSYNILVGTKRTLRANDDAWIPWAAMPTGNRVGLHLSFLAYAASSRAEWLKYDAQLDKAADVVADWCRRYGIPPVKLTAEQVRAGQRGICGHHEISLAWHESDHTDPGAGFPWDVFIQKVKARINPPKPAPTKEEIMAAFDEIKRRYKSRVANSKVELRPIDALMMADANSFNANRKADQIIKNQEKIIALLEGK